MSNIGFQEYRPLVQDPAMSPTLPGYLYHDAAVLEEEKRRIFYRGWQMVGHRSQLRETGDYLTGTLLDQRYFLVKDGEGAIRAFHNVCKHRAHAILDGSGNTRNALVCPYHAWTYRLDGSLRTARGTERMPAFDPADFGLAPIRLVERLGFLFITLNDEAAPLDETYAGLFADMETAMPWIGEAEVLAGFEPSSLCDSYLEANWKVLAENCLECYHCTPAHPAFVDLVAIDSYAVTDHGQWQKSYGHLRRSENKAYRVPQDAPIRDASFWHLFPNNQIGCMPGDRVASAFMFLPVDAERTLLKFFLLAPPGNRPTEERISYVGEILWPEDEALCVSVHQGLKSMGYRQGRFVMHPDRPGISENGVHHFQRTYAAAMGLGV